MGYTVCMQNKCFGLGGVSLAWPAVVQLLIFVYSGTQCSWPWVLVFVCRGGWFGSCVFAFGALAGLRAFVWAAFLCVSVLGVASAVEVLWDPRGFILLAVLERWSRCRFCTFLLCCLFCGRIVLGLVLCCFVLVFFDPFNIAITSFGKERANLGAFRMFVRFVLVWVLSVSSSSWCLERAAACDCGTLWTFLHFFLNVERFAFQFIKNFYVLSYKVVLFI